MWNAADAQSAWVVATVYVLCIALHLLIPTHNTRGYACNTESGAVLEYKHNGSIVHLVVTAVWALFGPSEILYRHNSAAAAGACALGVGFSCWMYCRPCHVDKRGRCLTVGCISGWADTSWAPGS